METAIVCALQEKREELGNPGRLEYWIAKLSPAADGLCDANPEIGVPGGQHNKFSFHSCSLEPGNHVLPFY
jgi:hypothetical protein